MCSVHIISLFWNHIRGCPLLPIFPSLTLSCICYTFSSWSNMPWRLASDCVSRVNFISSPSLKTTLTLVRMLLLLRYDEFNQYKGKNEISSTTTTNVYCFVWGSSEPTLSRDEIWSTNHKEGFFSLCVLSACLQMQSRGVDHSWARRDDSSSILSHPRQTLNTIIFRDLFSFSARERLRERERRRWNPTITAADDDSCRLLPSSLQF